ncbi:MAG: hypothetical protein QOF36_2309 [Microbacteriaceae bacterium]|jgi:hypothetical protein|nr:hypothetical protein [Microbacteriaceae bacterium]
MTSEPGSGGLVRAGLISRVDALAPVREFADPRQGRMIDVKLAGGLAFEVLADRGLDLGAVWWAGHPIAWRSPQPLGQVNQAGAEEPWLTRWSGGMLTTCGPDNIGPARDGYGLHGSHHGTPAGDVAWHREIRGEHVVVVVSGTIDNVETFGRRVTIHREIEAATDRASIEVRDRIRNDGFTPVPIPILYHLNFGAPFLEPGGLIEIASAGTVARDEHPGVPDYRRMPQVAESMAEAVFEHAGVDVADGRSSAIVHSSLLHARATLSWTSQSLPRLYQWVWPARGAWALGIEPANAPLFGSDRDGPHAGAPMLEAGASVDTGVRIEFARDEMP